MLLCFLISYSRCPLELGRKRPFTEEKNPGQKKRKWDTNGAIRKAQRDAFYFVDPLLLSDPILNNIRNGDFAAIYGARYGTIGK
ncbi:unnamed protein product [Rhizophagus irregularis]|uniref:Uncharacterized protein n=1 Tax=Rhizophagus irregularis TaxID=588596 RepID=A0A2N1NHW4_9GLOM|nr:hypothetical protein RhiirC2_776053 [Rhizophagus irregularis]CAB4381404.1 unnamed protein product [Rhizophagus irregularis]